MMPVRTNFQMYLLQNTPASLIKNLRNLANIRSIHVDSKRQSELFLKEQKRQREAVGRVEKIEVNYVGTPENVTVVMNKNISTPYDVAKHLGETIMNRSVVALLNNETLWHMHKPLPDSCTLELLHYQMTQPSAVNKVFWRTCSFILGAIANNAFQDKYNVQLHSFPSPNVRSGSFVYDVQLPLEDWQPSVNELKVLSIEMIKFCQQNHPIECLDVNTELALDMFKNNPHKTKQIPDIAAHHNGRVTLFKAGDHVDISRGPMATNTNHLGRITVTNVFKLNTDIEEGDGPIYRFQGVALPSSMVVNHFVYSLIEERARTLNNARLPGSNETISEDNIFVSQAV